MAASLYCGSVCAHSATGARGDQRVSAARDISAMILPAPAKEELLGAGLHAHILVRKVGQLFGNMR